MTGRRQLARAAVGLLAAGAAWLLTALRPFTVPIEVAVSFVILAMCWFVWRPPWPAVGPVRPTWRRVSPWLAVFIVLAAWELGSFASSPREKHPTLSWLADQVTSNHVGRAAVLVVWVELGWLLFRTRAPRA